MTSSGFIYFLVLNCNDKFVLFFAKCLKKEISAM